MSNKTIYTKYRFSTLNNLVFADDNNWYLTDSLIQVKVRFKNGRNGIYLNRKFKSLKQLRKLAYKRTELLIKKSTEYCPF
jgi:hypothetical protein